MTLLRRLIEIFRNEGFAGYVKALRQFMFWHPLLDEVLWRIRGLFTLKRFIIRDIGGYKMLIDPWERGLNRNLFMYGYHELECSRIFSEIMPGDCTVLDIGANIGYYVLIESGKAKKIYALEPSPRNNSLLRRNVELNHCEDRVEIHSLAVSDKAGEASLLVSGLPNHYRLLAADEKKTGRCINVPTTTIDEFIKDKPVDVIRMDLEGAEWLVLQGMQQLLRDTGRPLMLFIEVHTTDISRYGGDIGQMLAMLLNSGFKISHMVLSHLRPQGSFFHDCLSNEPNFWRSSHTFIPALENTSIPADLRHNLLNDEYYRLFLVRL